MTDRRDDTARAAAGAAGALAWVSRAVAVGALLVVAWVFATAGDAVWHGHPLYAILLALAVAAAGAALWVSFRRSARPGSGRTAGRIVLAVLGASGVAALAWLAPFPPHETARAAMESDATVIVTESPTGIALDPVGDYGAQPGDGTPTIDDDTARAEIAASTTDFVLSLTQGES